MGFNIEYVKDDNIEDVSENIYNDSTEEDWREWTNTVYNDVKAWLQNGSNKINICHVDFWGSSEEGYDCNCVLSREEINSIQDFIEYWNEKTRKLINI